MSDWSTTAPEIRDAAKSVLTHRQLDMYRLQAQGWSVRRISLALDVSPSTVQSTLNRAKQKIALELERRQDGTAVA